MGILSSNYIRTTTSTRHMGKWKGNWNIKKEARTKERCEQAAISDNKIDGWYWDGDKCRLGTFDKPKKWQPNNNKHSVCGVLGFKLIPDIFLYVMIVFGIIVLLIICLWIVLIRCRK